MFVVWVVDGGCRVKKLFLISLLIGGLISGTLIALEKPTNFAYINWELPGHAAAFVFWGMLGWSTNAGLTVAWFVNAILYGAAVYIVIRLFKLALRR
jgi:hypothetical protein